METIKSEVELANKFFGNNHGLKEKRKFQNAASLAFFNQGFIK